MRDQQREGPEVRPWRRGFLILGLVLAFGAFGLVSAQEEGKSAEAAAEEEKSAEAAAEEEIAEAVAEVEEAPAAVATEDNPFELDGALSLSYRARIRGDDNDEDLYGYLRIDVARAKERDLSLHFYGRGTFDIDNDEDEGRSVFFSLNDSSGRQFETRLYEAYVDLEGAIAPTSLGVRRIRLGRQRIYAGLSFLVDGARIDFQPVEDLGNLEVSIFGGSPEFFYEGSRRGDWLTGIDVNFRPSDATRFDFRYVHIEDRNEWFGGENSDDFVSMSLMQELFEDLRVFATWNTTGFDTRDVRARASLDIPDWDVAINLMYYYQENVTREFTTLLDAFEGVLGTSFAYHQVDLEISKWFGDHFGLDLGATVRELEDDADEAAFNREYQRVWLSFMTQEWPVEDVGFSLTLEWWDGAADEALTAGGEVDWRATKDVRVNFGSYYSLYKYDLFVVDERSDVTTIFLRVRWKVLTDLRLDGRYEYETGDEGNYHIFFVGFDWRF